MIRCIAIDDEPLALKQMENYMEKTPFLEFLEVLRLCLRKKSYWRQPSLWEHAMEAHRLRICLTCE